MFLECSAQTAYINVASNSDFSSSSLWDSQHGMDRSRLHTIATTSNTGGFSALYNQAGEWIGVDFRSIRHIERVATQGRAACHSWAHIHGCHNQWVTSYKIAYSFDNSFYQYTTNSDGSDQVFTGNTNRDTVVANDVFFTARYARLYVQSWSGHISIRWEFYGCPYEGNIVMQTLSYSPMVP